jgi:hypothetical protein
MDELYLTDILFILKDLANPIYETTDVFKYIKMYITRNLLQAKKLKGFLWKDKGAEVLLVKPSDAPWHLAESEDVKDFAERLAERKDNILKNLNTVIGFMNNFKTEEFVVFKTKNINNARDAGARCDQITKNKAMEVLTSIVSEFTEPPDKNISQKEVCVIQEMYLRLYDQERKDKKRWFLSPPDAVLTKIDKYSTVVKKVKKNKK